MNKYRIRFNRSRGREGRGTINHVWRVFEGNNEHLVKNLQINVSSCSEKDENGIEWNIICYGTMTIDKETSTAIIN
jgi:hypothetical protein